MTIAFVNAAGASGVNTHSTGSTNMSGANCLVVFVISYRAAGAPTFSDSLGNLYALVLTVTTTTYLRLEVYICVNATVSSGMTFTSTGSGIYGSFEVAGYSNVATSSALDQQSSATGVAVSLSTGSVTPSAGDELLVAGGGFIGFASGGAYVVTSPFTTRGSIDYSGSNFGVVLGDEIQTSATPRNPMVGSTGVSLEIAAAIVTLKEAAAGGGFIDRRFPRGILRGAA